jgi:hypothetical protein
MMLRSSTSAHGPSGPLAEEREAEVLERLRHVQKLLDAIPLYPKRILDIAGNATTSAYWARQYPSAEVYCVNVRDIPHSPDLRIKDLRQDVTLGPLPISGCDFIFAGEIIEHVYEIDAFMVNMLASAADGAHLAITTPNLAVWTNRLLLLLGQAPFNYDAMPVKMPRLTWLRAPPPAERNMCKFDYHIRLFTMPQLLYFLSHHGIRPLKCTTVMSTEGRWGASIKKLLAWLLPRSMRDTLVVLGLVGSKT